jgi:DNA-binding NtrC family response regulator
MNILVIDDEPDIVVELCGYFKRRGHRVVGAEGVEPAFHALAGDTKFDLVLADMRMPAGSGEDVLRVCTRVVKPCPALILMTGLADESDIQRAMGYGALTVFRKPLVPRQLEEAVRLAEQFHALRDSAGDRAAQRPSVFYASLA